MKPTGSSAAFKPSLRPILEREMAIRFLAWMEADHRAWHAGEKEMSLQINASLFQQKTFKYQANTLVEPGRKFSTVSSNRTLCDWLD